jgi:hypothetical protein
MGGPSALRERGSPQVDRTDGWPPKPLWRLDRIPPTGRLTVNLVSSPSSAARLSPGWKARLASFRNVASVDVVLDDQPRRRPSSWEPLELLALAGLMACAAIIVVQGGAGLALHSTRVVREVGWSASLEFATGWTDNVAIVLLLVLGLAWATVSRWSGVMSDEFDLAENSGQRDESPVTPIEESTEPDRPAGTPDESTAGFHEARGRLARVHATLLATSVLLFVTFLAGALRVATVVYEQQRENSPFLAPNLLEELGSFLFVALVAVFGLVVVVKLARLCHWRD